MELNIQVKGKKQKKKSKKKSKKKTRKKYEFLDRVVKLKYTQRERRTKRKKTAK
tara:strand:- start:495 stop:656 length:162 start_codon:yes stop_codon:yes gene_type:complete